MSVIISYASRRSAATAGTRSELRWTRKRFGPILLGLLAFPLVLILDSRISQGAESNSPPTSPSQIESTNLQQLLRTCLQIQEQLRSTQLALEQNRQEIKATAAQNAEAVPKGLQVIQEAFAAQRAQDLEAMQRSNRLVLIAAGTLAAMSLLTMLVLTCFLWRMSKTSAGISAALPAALGLGQGSALAATGPVEQSRLRLLGAMEQLDKRIHEFKGAIGPGGNGDLALDPDCGSPAAGAEPSQDNEHARISLLLNQAHSLMKLDNPGAALACFEAVLALNANHTEALVKKGAALERLHRLNEAIECYDRAIAVDSSMTTAYLHKGGLCNRLERFKEALQCYEKALHTHDQRGS
jgi:tetratricopeptide (TPR) repeat protein